MNVSVDPFGGSDLADAARAHRYRDLADAIDTTRDLSLRRASAAVGVSTTTIRNYR